jgi:divalent metal cation (Fe/Co/Zn/Cd) transporter
MKGMSAERSLPAAALPSIRRIQLITVAWMTIEVLVSVIAAVRAHSVVLLAFGGDSLIELASALVVFFRFTDTIVSERTAAKSTAVLLFLLVVFIAVAAGLSVFGRGPQPQPSFLGIGLLLAAAAIMPWLARQKRRLAHETDSSALAADAVQSSVCAWLAWIALAGLLVNYFFKISWADPLAALTITPLVIREGREAWKGRGCHCR